MVFLSNAWYYLRGDVQELDCNYVYYVEKYVILGM